MEDIPQACERQKADVCGEAVGWQDLHSMQQPAGTLRVCKRPVIVRRCMDHTCSCVRLRRGALCDAPGNLMASIGFK